MKRKIIIVVAAVAVLAFVVAQTGRCARFGDTRIFFAAGRALAAGEDLYVSSHMGDSYLYPPFFAVLMVPFARLPVVVAAAIWTAANVASLFLLFALSFYLLERPPERVGPWLRAKAARAFAAGKINWVVFAAVVASARFWLDNVGYGHVNIHLWTLSLAAVYFARGGKNFLGGALLGAAVATKFITAPVLLFLIVKKEYRAAAWAVVVAALFFVAPAAVLGWARNAALLAAWRESVLGSTVREYYYLALDFNQSLSSLLYSYWKVAKGAGGASFVYKPPGFRYASWAAAAAFVSPVLLSFLIHRRRTAARARALTDGLQLALVILAGVILQPASWVSHYVGTVFPYMAVLYGVRVTPGRATRWLCGSLVILSVLAHSIIGGDFWGHAIKTTLYNYKVITWAALALYAAVVIMLYGYRDPGSRRATL